MVRTFIINKVRKFSELSEKLWNFIPLDGKTFPVHVPSAWETYPGYEAYRGEGRYSTVFNGAGNVRLVFKGVSHTARVYVDGAEVGTHYNAYTPFDIVVKGLAEGEHTLEVVADNRFSEASALHIPNDYMSYGGITRGVVLERLKGAYIKWAHFTPKRVGERWRLEVSVCLRNISEADIDAKVSVNFPNAATLNLSANLTPDGESVVTGQIDVANAETWNMENPKLYEVETLLAVGGEIVDDLIERTGLREVTVDGGYIQINGQKVRFKGFCRHEDHPAYGCALPFAQIAADLQIIKDLGANSVRTSHYPNDEIFLDLCDELGILVWEENHARGLSEEHMRNPNFERQAEEVIREMVTQHYNHPCIYIWGILNECASDTAYGRECYGKQYALIKELDSSRPRSSASFKYKTDICLDFPEVVSYNIYPKWYRNAPVWQYLDELYRWVQEETPGKPFLITETGAGAIYGYRHPSEVKWTEEYQAKLLTELLTTILEYPGAQGVYIWQYCDVRISEEWFANRPRTMNNKGVVDEYRRPKLSYSAVKNIFDNYGNYF